MFFHHMGCINHQQFDFFNARVGVSSKSKILFCWRVLELKDVLPAKQLDYFPKSLHSSFVILNHLYVTWLGASVNGVMAVKNDDCQ